MLDDWAAQGECWSNLKTHTPNARTPLILSGHGMRLQINHGALEVQNGFTHYPQEQEKCRFFPGDPFSPSRIILLDGSGAITLDVIAWLSVQNIPLIQLDYRGQVVAAIGANGLGADPELLQLQVATAQHPEKSLAVATWLVREKLLASRQTVLRLAPSGEVTSLALGRLDTDAKRLAKPWTGLKTALLGIEGKCAKLYFDAWRDIPLSWIGTGRKPIPETWRRIGPRQTRLGQNNQFAKHPIQAMLNYAYGVLQSQIRIETARVGLDQTMGFLHQAKPDRPALILDLLEPLRPVIDDTIIRFVQAQTFSPADFTLSSEGTCRIHPQLARRVVAEIGQIEDFKPVFAGLLKQLGYAPALTRQHRSTAWLAQKRLVSTSSACLTTLRP